MPKLQTNILVNMAGQGWTVLVQLLAVPVYLRLLGVENYGLIAIFATLMATLQIFDLGFSQTLVRELARREASQAGVQDARDLVRTLEVPYWAIGISLGLLLLLLGPMWSDWVLQDHSMHPALPGTAIQLMACALVLQWPVGLYAGGLLGMQKLVPLNIARVVLVSVSAGGAILCLLLIEPSIQVFFTWHVIANLFSVSMIRWLLHASLPGDPGATRFRPALLRQVWRFAAGVSVVGILGIALGQADRWVLMNVLSLKDFGYYALAGSVAAALYGLVAPIQSALFPRLSFLVARGDESALSAVYHAAQQLLACVVLPVALVLSLFSAGVLEAWTGNSDVAARSGPVLALLALGTGLNGLMYGPFVLQLAYGMTRLQGLIAGGFFCMVIPMVGFAGSRYGGLGAAAVWLGLNATYMLIAVPLTHHYVLRGQAARWFLADVLPAALAGSAMAGLARLAQPDGLGRIALAAWIGAAAALTLIAAGMATAEARSRAMEKIAEWYGR